MPGRILNSLPATIVAAVLFLGMMTPVAARAQAASGAGDILLRGGAATRVLTIAEIEALPMFEALGRTGAREEPSPFHGVLLSDLVELIGAGNADKIVVRASDGYAADIPREDWTRWPVLFATRQDGKHLTIRMRGPARIIYPADTHPELASRAYIDRSVWLISEIEW